MNKWDVIQIISIIAATIGLVVVMRLRKRSQARFFNDFAEQEICEHLRPALQLLKQRGHAVVRVGQQRPEMPLEIHLAPSFEPKAIAAELKLAEPVFISERNVLYCKQDWIELRPVE